MRQKKYIAGPYLHRLLLDAHAEYLLVEQINAEDGMTELVAHECGNARLVNNVAVTGWGGSKETYLTHSPGDVGASSSESGAGQ